MRRCMIIDDSSVIRKAARRILAKPELLIVEAENGAEALDMCTVEMPDLVIVDGTLPDMAAEDFIASLKERCSNDNQPSIFVCVPEVDIRVIMRAKRAGAKDFVLKPFDRQSLLGRFEQLQVAL